MPIDVKQFRQSLTYATKSSINQIITDLYEIAEIDRLAELKQQEYAKKALYYFLGIIISIVLLIVVFDIFTGTEVFFWLIILIIASILGLLIALITAFIKRSEFSRINIINFRYQVTENILQMLSRDISQSAEIKLNLSFKSTEDNEHKISTLPHPSKPGWQINNYQQEWITIQGQFLDKTRFELSGTAISKKQYGWKRGASGKNKYKSKVKSLGLELHLNLSYSQRRYGAVKILQKEAVSAVKLPKFSELRGLRVTDKSIQLVVRVAPSVAEKQEEVYQTVTAMFLSLYQVLNLAKALSKQPS
ncbi:MAG: hypothetical protein VKL60_00550 [Sphaerospermopsis sp.]|nr:hypothetical protein [Sphaerospermopsis sp.]